MTNQARRFTAEDFLTSAVLLERAGYKEFPKEFRQAAATEAQFAGLVEQIEAIAESWKATANNTSGDDYSFGRMQVATVVIEELLEALSKFRGEDHADS